MSASFEFKQLRASLILPNGTFFNTESNTLVLSGLRMSAHLVRAGNWTNTCDLTIFGMKQEDMNFCTVLFGQGGNILAINDRAILKLESNNGGPNDGWLQIFEGQFQQAQPDYSNMPDVGLKIQAATGAGQQYLMASPTSKSGSTNVVDLAQQLASQMGFAFENNGVTGQLSSPYLTGTPLNQFRELADAAGFDYYLDATSTLIICPPNQGRQGKQAVVIGPQSGMINDPTLNQYGIDVDVLFSPAIALGWPIQIVDSVVPGTNGVWYPRTLVDDLECLVIDGKWHSHLSCSPFAMD